MHTPKALDGSKIAPDNLFHLFDRSVSGVFYWDPSLNQIEWSPNFLAALGYEAGQDAKYEQVEQLLHPDDRTLVQTAIDDARAGGDAYSTSFRILASTGDYKRFEAFGQWFTSDDGGDYLAGYVRDLSDLDEARARARRSDELLKAFFNHAPAAAYMKDNQRRHVYGNALAAKIAGCTVEEFIGKTTAELFDEETDRALVEVDRRILEEGETVVRHGEFEAANGDKHYVYDTTFPVEDPTTGQKYIGGVALDTTRQHNAELALGRAQKMEALGQLVGGVAHDFNNILAVLQGNVELFDSSETDDEMQECLSEIAKGVDRGARLTKQLLAYVRKSVLNPELVNLNDVIQDTDRFLRRKLPASIGVETVSGGGLWMTKLDRGQIENALLNLALNRAMRCPTAVSLPSRRAMCASTATTWKIATKSWTPDAMSFSR